MLLLWLCISSARGVVVKGGDSAILRPSGGIYAIGGSPVYKADAERGVTLSAAAAAAWCVLDGRGVLRATCSAGVCDCVIDGAAGAGSGLHSVAMYEVREGQAFRLRAPIWLQLSGGAGAPQRSVVDAALRAATPRGTGRLGVYTTSYSYAWAQVYQNITRVFNRTVTMEDVIANGGFINSSLWDYQSAAASPRWATGPGSIFQDRPLLGIYCLYKKRANESAGLMPDCPETSSVLRTHAALMHAVGIEFVAPDSTNTDADPRWLPGESDFTVLRPLELMADEWAAMRAEGLATPQLSIFARVSGGPLWRWFLDGLYNNETLLSADLILRSNASSGGGFSKKVFFAAAQPASPDRPGWDKATVDEIAENGGRDDVVVPLMWQSPNATSKWEESGFLSYVSPCVSNGSYSTDAPWVTDAPCDHRKTHTSPIGAVWTASAAVPAGSVPLLGHKLHGLHLKKQFWDVLADPNATDFLFSPSWNEFVANAVNLTVLGTNPFFAMLGARRDDVSRASLFVDSFAAEHSRTLEPSVSDGGHYFELLASCMRVYRLQRALGVVSNGTGCSVAGEECCAQRADESFTLVYSFDAPWRAPGRGGDAVATSDAAEARSLAAAGWREVCAATTTMRADGAPTLACTNTTLRWLQPADGSSHDPAYSVLRGPFLLYAHASGANVSGAVPIVRCVVGGDPPRHFLDSSPACEGGAAETVIGYAAGARSGGFASALSRCWSADGGGMWYHSLRGSPFGDCAEGDTLQAVLGYVI
jgi:hypothetical protein